MSKKGGDISGGAGGAKKIHNRGAFMILTQVKRAHVELLNAPLKKSERDPITRELKAIKAFIEKIAYTPPEELYVDMPTRVTATPYENRDIINQHRDLITDMIVKGHSAQEMKRELYKASKQVVHIMTIRAYRSEYKLTDEYEKRYQEFIGSVDSMRLYTKAGRVEELTTLYLDTKQAYQHTPSREHMNQLLKILDQARRESDSPAVYNFKLEQNNLNINGSVVFNLLNTEVQKDLFKRLPINEIILGRLAAKTGIDPVVMMNRLHNSYYATQAGVNGIQQIDAPIKYPSELHYDIEDMIDQNKKLIDKEQKIVEQNNNVVDSTKDELKQKLLARIKLKKQNKE